MTETFASARLAMRPMRADDADALHIAYRDVDLMRYWSSAPHATPEESRAYVAARLDNPAQRGGDWRGWVMTIAGDDTAIGTLATGAHKPGVAEIGYLLARPYWGKGYAKEGVSRLIDVLIREEGHRRVFADTDPDNAGSNRLLASLGFRLEGVLRGEWETHIGVRDTNLWGLLAHEWTGR